MGIQRSPEKGITILGGIYYNNGTWKPYKLTLLFLILFFSLGYWSDIVLKDKFIVYDLDAQRIGWADHDCEFIYKTNE